MGFPEIGDSPIFFLKRVLCCGSYGIVSWSSSLFRSIKIEDRKLKDKIEQKNYLRKDSFSDSALVKSVRPRQACHKRLAKTSINKGHLYIFLIAFSVEGPQCLFLIQMYTALLLECNQPAGKRQVL